jgi:hypothetical protein
MLRFSTVYAGAAVLLLLAASQDAGAAACRDAKGHFAACPPPKTAAVERCRSASGQLETCAQPAPPRAAAAPKRPNPAAPWRAATGAAVNTAAVAPGAVTARCRDGTESHSPRRSGTCASHGGVAAWR